MRRLATTALFALMVLVSNAAAQNSRQPAKPAPVPIKSPTSKPTGAQPQPESPTSTPTVGDKPVTPVAKVPSGVELGDKPYVLEGAGLTMLLPLGCTAQSNRAAGRVAAQIVPDDSTWLINIHTPRTSNPDTSAAEVCDQMVTEYFKQAGEVYDLKPGEAPDPSKLAGLKGKLIELRKTITINNRSADRVYFSVPGNSTREPIATPKNGPKDPPIVRGLTAFRTTRDQFVIFELVTTEPVYEKAKRIYEVAIATAQFQDPARVNADRAAAVDAGKKVLSQFDADAYKTLIDSMPERWERRYKPSASGADSDATELGYRRVKVVQGTRGMIDSSRVRQGAGDRQEGFIVQMDARVLEQGYVIDSRSAFFVTPDHADEAWTVQNAIRKDKKTEIISETGARSGLSMSVQVEGSGMPGKTIKPTFQSDGYLSRVESWILPQLLIKSGVATDFGFYTYQSDASTVCLRRDTLEQPVDRPGLWKLTTKLAENKPAQVGYYTAKGELIRTEMPDGSVWEPITLQRLAQLWKAKDLPMK